MSAAHKVGQVAGRMYVSAYCGPRLSCRGLSFEGWLFHRNADDAGPHHAERASRAHRYVDNAPPNKGTAIVDPALY
jgi:hypothetical protein